MVAYSSISHMGFVIVGLATLTVTGLVGAVMQMFTHGIITALLFLLVGVFYVRTHTRDVAEFAGLSRQVPLYSTLLAIGMLASMGLPGLAGFISEFHVLLGGYQSFGLYIAIASIGILVTAAYTLNVVGLLFTGQVNPKWSVIPDINPRELAAALPLAALTVAIGILPGPALKLVNATITQLVLVFK